MTGIDGPDRTTSPSPMARLADAATEAKLVFALSQLEGSGTVAVVSGVTGAPYTFLRLPSEWQVRRGTGPKWPLRRLRPFEARGCRPPAGARTSVMETPNQYGALCP